MEPEKEPLMGVPWYAVPLIVPEQGASGKMSNLQTPKESMSPWTCPRPVKFEERWHPSWSMTTLVSVGFPQPSLNVPV